MEGGTVLPAGNDEVRCWWATIRSIVENEYNIAAGRYKPQIADKAPNDEPTELIRETLIIEREIIEGLESLRRKIEGIE